MKIRSIRSDFARCQKGGTICLLLSCMLSICAVDVTRVLLQIRGKTARCKLRTCFEGLQIARFYGKVVGEGFRPSCLLGQLVAEA